MEFDQFGLPKSPGFDDEPPKHRAKITKGRLLAVAFTLVLAATLGVLAEHGPGIFDDLADKFGELNQDSPRKAMRRVMNHLQHGRDAEAMRECDRLIEMNPEMGYEFRAIIHTKRQNFDAAIDDYSNVIRLNPNGVRHYVRRADLYGLSGRYEQSIADYDRAIELDPNLALAYNNRAYNRALARVDIEEALEDIKRALSIEQDNSAYVDTRGYIYYLLGRFDEALADFNHVLDELAPTEGMPPIVIGEIQFHRGLVHKALGDNAAAQRDFASAKRHGFRITDYPPPLILEEEPRDSEAPAASAGANDDTI